MKRKKSHRTRRRSPARSVRWWLVLTCILVLLTFFAQGVWFYLSLNRPVPRPPVPELVTIERGWPASRIADALHEKGLVASPAQFVVAARAEGLTTRLRAGTFLIPPGHSPRSLARYLATTPPRTPRVFIPAGATADQVVDLLRQKGITGADAAAGLITDATFIAGLGLGLPTLEGYLFPDIYEYDETATASELMARMVNRFREVAAEIGLATAEVHLQQQNLLPLSARQVVVLASVIQREAGPQPDKEMVSRVFHNRLLRGMRLESCATIRRAINEWHRPLTLGDLQVDSPYNTYKQKGLPDAPICNPGKGSLIAALNPAPGDVLYFVARGDGTNYFTNTYEEHLRAKEEYLGSP